MLRRSVAFTHLILFTVAVSACSGPMPHADASADSDVDHASLDAPNDAPTICTADVDCTDHVFCNGAERCMPGAAGADVHGCIAPSAASPCMATQTCSESMQRCITHCDTSPDADSDGHRAIACGGDDCDDADANRFPGNAELCDAMHDEDCDPCTVARAPTATAPSDGDRDNDTFVSVTCGNAFSGARPTCDPRDSIITATLVTGSDCDDTVRSTHSGATESCNGVDDNCNGSIDEGLPTSTFYPDCDGDGFGDQTQPEVGTGCASQRFPECMAHAAVANHDDCNDTQATVHLGAPEICDMLDNDCNGMTDEGTTVAYYRDADGDSYGDPTMSMRACPGATPVGYVLDSMDCDDSHMSCHPGGTEVCDGLDNNCNGTIDEGLLITYYQDADGDTYGTSMVTVQGCPGAAPAGYVTRAGDCCDTDPRANPFGGAQITPRVGCGGFDFNCDGFQNGDNLLQSGTCTYSASTGTCGGATSGWLSFPACGAMGTFASSCTTTAPGSMTCTQPTTMRARACR